MADDPQIQADQPEQPERPDWLPDNFKTPEDLAKSYGELQNEFRQTREQLKAQQAQLEEYLAAQEQQQPQQPEVPFDQLEAAYQENPLGTMAWLAQQAAQAALGNAARQQQEQYAPHLETQNHLLAYAAEQMLAQQHDDWDEYKTRVGDMIQQDQGLLPESALSSPEATARALDRVYKIVKAEDVMAQAQNLGQSQADQLRQQKMQAQTIAGVAGRPDAPSDDEEHFARLMAAANKGYAAHRASGGS